jgi:hypothetical protein
MPHLFTLTGPRQAEKGHLNPGAGRYGAAEQVWVLGCSGSGWDQEAAGSPR